jgi:hypothetical protein
LKEVLIVVVGGGVGESNSRDEPKLIGPDFEDHAITRGATVKWSGQAYSVCDTGIETTFQEILIVVESGGGGGEKILAMSPNRPRL